MKIEIPDQREQRRRLADQKASETVNQSISQGLDPLLCVVVLQTCNGLTVRAASDTRVLPDDDKMEMFLSKVRILVEEFVSASPNLTKVPGTGPS